MRVNSRLITSRDYYQKIMYFYGRAKENETDTFKDRASFHKVKGDVETAYHYCKGMFVVVGGNARDTPSELSDLTEEHIPIFERTVTGVSPYLSDILRIYRRTMAAHAPYKRRT